MLTAHCSRCANHQTEPSLSFGAFPFFSHRRNSRTSSRSAQLRKQQQKDREQTQPQQTRSLRRCCRPAGMDRRVIENPPGHPGHARAANNQKEPSLGFSASLRFPSLTSLFPSQEQPNFVAVGPGADEKREEFQVGRTGFKTSRVIEHPSSTRCCANNHAKKNHASDSVPCLFACFSHGRNRNSRSSCHNLQLRQQQQKDREQTRRSLRSCCRPAWIEE